MKHCSMKTADITKKKSNVLVKEYIMRLFDSLFIGAFAAKVANRLISSGKFPVPWDEG